MNRTSSPGLGEWLFMTILVGVVVFLLYQLYQYSEFRNLYPAGLTVASVNVGGLNREDAGERLSERYLQAPVVLFHGEERVTIQPTSDAEFTLDLEQMLSDADYQKDQQDFWAGFWGYLWGRPVEVDSVPLYATHNRDTLIDTLEILASQLDNPTQPPQPVPTTLSFQYGEPGQKTEIAASLRNVENALYRATDREARLVVDPVEPKRPDMNLLARLIVNHMEDFDGMTSVFILDIESGEEIGYNADVALSGMTIMQLPIVVEAFRLFDGNLTISQTTWLSKTIVGGDEQSANELLALIAGQNDPFLGAEIVTRSMQRLGLLNTFISLPYGEEGRFTYSTPANSREDWIINADIGMQTTAEDMGTLLSMIYYCAQNEGGALKALYANQISGEECRQILGYMQRNYIGSLIQEGVPDEIPVAHKHGWISDTHGDAGIVFSSGGDYIVVTYLYKPGWLEWELSSPLMADISRATYNFFNFDAPYLGN